tara:strand:+ start:169 stop:555 length:387 start_codon:yes stop_codon:yes gene_type:complete
MEESIKLMIKNNKIERFQNEIDNSKTDEDRKKQLKKIMKHIENEKNEEEIKKDVMKKYMNELKKDVYKKKWSYLDKELKIDRVKLYCKENKIEEETIEKIIGGIKEGTFKGSLVKYDHKIGLVKDIKV